VQPYRQYSGFVPCKLDIFVASLIILETNHHLHSP
jgi:hypothetical protein